MLSTWTLNELTFMAREHHRNGKRDRLQMVLEHIEDIDPDAARALVAEFAAHDRQ